MGEVVKATAKVAKKGIKTQLKIWFACILATILVVGSVGGSFLILSKVFETKLNQMVNDQYKGETGEPGPQGPQGVSILSIEKTGSSGNYDIYTISYSNGLTTTFQVKNGDDGEAPIIGENGNWWINGEDTGVLADVELNMPYIGPNGNWWVGESDTNVKAKGEDGLTPYIKDGNWWIGETDTGVVASGTGTGTGMGITSITPLDKTSTEYQTYMQQHPDLAADLTDVYKILYSNSSVSYFTVTNGRDGSANNVVGSNGTNGANANQWLSGNNEPAETLGNPGDFYLDTYSNVVYQKQVNDGISNKYNGVLTEKTLALETFNDMQTNAANYGLNIGSKTITYVEGITKAQITAFANATKESTSFYTYLWNYVIDNANDKVHLFGYYAADGALEINETHITEIHYKWQSVTTLKGTDGKDGGTAYEVWKNYTEEDGTQPNINKTEEEFLSSLIIGSLEDFTILPSGFWGKKTDLTDANFETDSEEEEDEEVVKIPESEQYLYEKVDGVYYKNTMVSARGEQGATGQKGEQGAQGARGYSAYELYTQTTTDNPVKSLDDWFASLVGAKGEQGDKGQDGATPVIGPNGNWWISGADTHISATVRLPYIGDNGNWFINGVDQGIKPQGDRGNGIAKIEKSTVDGVVDTYVITYTDDNMEPFIFTVTNGIDGTNGKSSYEIWRDYVDADGKQPNLLKSEADFFAALMGTDGNGIESIEMVQSNATTGVDTYRITYTNETTFDFTIKNGRDGKSVYEIWCEQKGYTDYADNKYYADFIDEMTVSTIEGLTVLSNGHWGVLSNYATLAEAEADDPEGNYETGYQNKIYKDTGNTAKGDSGANGKSAYEIYCETFRADPRNADKEPISTEFAWIESLKGATGAAGKDATLSISEDGYWVINGTEFRNMKVQGEKGADGATPVIGEDGYWYINGQPTGISARGEKGEKGDKGDIGVSISAVEKTAQEEEGNKDIYTITFSNGSTSTFTVTNGTDGVDGKDGSDITMDFGVPNAAAKDGDIYINLNNGEMYRYSTDDGWGEVAGTMRGSQWFTGTLTLTELNTTTAGTMIDGYNVIKNDLYLNTSSYDIYKYTGKETKWVKLGNLRGAGAVKTDPIAWFDTTTLPDMPDGAAIGKWGIGGDTNWTNWHITGQGSKSNGILKVQRTSSTTDVIRLHLEYVQLKPGYILIIKWRSLEKDTSVTPCAFFYDTSWEVLSGSLVSTGDWQTTVVKITGCGSTLQAFGIYSWGNTLELESYYIGNLDYSTQLMDLSGNYHNMTVNGNYMTNDGLVLNQTVQTPMTSNTTNMTYFVDFANVQQNSNSTPLFAIGTPTAGAANQFSIDIAEFGSNPSRPLFINNAEVGRTVNKGNPLQIAVRVDGEGKCQYTVDGVVWQNVNTDAAAAVSGAQLYFGASGSTLRRAMVFDTYLDDAAVYAVFNHQIADLPNPQSPYKKDNPKTWGDGVLIDFGDGTYGIAKKFTFNPNATDSHSMLLHYSNVPDKYKDMHFLILDWGGLLSASENNGALTWYFTLQAFNYWTPNSPLISSLHADQIDGFNSISINLLWTNGVPDRQYLTGEAWVWVIFTAV